MEPKKKTVKTLKPSNTVENIKKKKTNSRKKSKDLSSAKERKIKGKKKDEKERKQHQKSKEKVVKKKKLIEILNLMSINFLSAFSSLFILASMTIGLFKIIRGNTWESIVAGLVCAIFIIIGTWFNERI